jgi:hypothetical protein
MPRAFDNRWLRLGSDLPVPERRLLQSVLAHFVRHGTAPDQAALTTMAQAADLSVSHALAELTRRDLIIYDASSATLQGAYPFSGDPTPHAVHIDGGPAVFAMCALDALGIAFLLGRDTTVFSRDAITGARLRVDIASATGTAMASPQSVVMFAPSAPYEGPAATCLCPLLAFFGSLTTAEAYERAHRESDGRILPLMDAVAAGRRTFEDPGDYFLPPLW